MLNFLKLYFKKNTFLSNILIKAVVLNKNYKISPRNDFIDDNSKNNNFNKINFHIPGKEAEIFNKRKFKFNEKYESVSGYVPYVKDQTNLIFYNFFSTNYGIRKNLAANMYALGNNKIFNAASFTLPSNSILKINLEELDFFKNLSNEINSIVIELFSPFLKKGHGGHDGHFRFWGNYSETGAIVHSMPVPKGVISNRKVLSERRIFPKLDKNYTINFKSLFNSKKNIIFNDIKNNNMDKNYYGYNIIRKDHHVRAVWHDSMLVTKKIPNIPQIIPVLPIKNLNCHIFLAEYTANENENINFELFNDEDKLISSNSKNLKKNEEINITELFPELDNKKFYSIIASRDPKFEKNKPGYLHTFYSIDNNIADCVHSLHLRKSNQIFKNLEMNNYKKQALKFMYFNLKNDKNSYIAIIGTNYSHNIKLRLILPDGRENIINTKINPKIIHFYSLNELFLKNNIELSDCNEGIIQLECLDFNLDAAMFIYDKKMQSIAVDHFTGG